MDNKENDLKQIGERIRNARRALKISQAELAFRAKVSTPHISDIECGKTNIMIDTFANIIEALQVSADEILRPNTPIVNQLYQREFNELLSDCSPSEIESILKIVKEVKTSIHKTED